MSLPLPSRMDALATINAAIAPESVCVYSLGFISRDAYSNFDRPRNLYLIGGMGLSGSVAMGVAMCRPDLPVFAIEGDASAVMETGTIILAGSRCVSNFCHIVLDNELNLSSGGQESFSRQWLLADLADAAGYRQSFRCESLSSFAAAIHDSQSGDNGPSFILVKISEGSTPMAPARRVDAGLPEVALRLRSAIGSGVQK